MVNGSKYLVADINSCDGNRNPCSCSAHISVPFTTTSLNTSPLTTSSLTTSPLLLVFSYSHPLLSQLVPLLSPPSPSHHFSIIIPFTHLPWIRTPLISYFPVTPFPFPQKLPVIPLPYCTWTGFLSFIFCRHYGFWWWPHFRRPAENASDGNLWTPEWPSGFRHVVCETYAILDSQE